jgi:DGQHR domain-containing protein
MTSSKTTERGVLTVRALCTQQGDGIDVYAFFVPGGDLLRIAEISRVHRSDDGVLHGFQRKEILTHVRSITEFLNQGPVLFPNAIILALAPSATFVKARGTKPSGDSGASEAGTLRIPMPTSGPKAAWIVDGQQRSIALSNATDPSFPVPVIAFVSEDVAMHREQFILVNKARPLPPRLINELLPEVSAHLPRDLAPRRIPSELVNLLNTSPDSPLRGLIRRTSDDSPGAVIVDTALMKVVSNSIRSPLGALAPFKASGDVPADTAAMYAILSSFWAAVRDAFPDAWGLPPTQSRLMHSAGIMALGVLMDRVMSRLGRGDDPYRHALESLSRIAPHCRWTSGQWPGTGREWNDIQNVTKDVRLLADQLMRLDHAYAFTKAA